LRCRNCGRRLTGHVNRYRHIEACREFQEARPSEFADRRGKGDSYAAIVFDNIARRALAYVVANAQLIAEVADSVTITRPHPVEFNLARIRRDRQLATSRLEADRDVTAWKATMERLDQEDAATQDTAPKSITSAEVAEYLGSVRDLFLDAEPATQQRILKALFEDVEVLGPNEVWIHPTAEAEARGWAAAMSGEFRVEMRKTGRGERTRTYGNDLTGTVRVARRQSAQPTESVA
jgi:hypothetical protein